jgi:hypothetical protein
MLYRDLQRSGDHQYQVMGFIDDDPAMWSSLLGGRRVLGGLAALPRIIDDLRVNTLLVAIPRKSPAIVRELVTICTGLNVQIKVLPVSYIYFQEQGPASMLHDLAPQDLLARQPCHVQRTRAIAARGTPRAGDRRGRLNRLGNLRTAALTRREPAAGRRHQRERPVPARTASAQDRTRAGSRSTSWTSATECVWNR